MGSHSEGDEYLWSTRRARWFNQAVEISDFPAQTLKANIQSVI